MFPTPGQGGPTLTPLDGLGVEGGTEALALISRPSNTDLHRLTPHLHRLTFRANNPDILAETN